MTGLWFTSLLEREQQNTSWLNNGRPASYWMTGFFNPQGFLTAMKQEVTRLHKKDNPPWALDDVVYHTQVTEHEHVEHVRTPPKEGVYIHGLYLDGCAWSKPHNTLVESEPKVLFHPLPVLYVTGVTKSQKKESKSQFGSQGPYECPCYKYPARTDRYIIFMVDLNTAQEAPSHWVLRGTGLLCSTD